jgi:myosin heavy subunit
MLSVDPAKLNAVLINRTSVTRGETFVTPLNNVQAIDGRDAMAKAIYGRMFSWIISSINESTAKFSAENRFVGVLDIFGFEDFKVTNAINSSKLLTRIGEQL